MTTARRLRRARRHRRASLTVGALAGGGRRDRRAAGGAGPRTPARGRGSGPQGRVPQFEVECACSHAAPTTRSCTPACRHVAPPRLLRQHRHRRLVHRGRAPAGGATTCKQARHRRLLGAGPVRHGAPVTPLGSVAYYRPGPGVDPASVEPYPAGLMMIGGDAHAPTARSRRRSAAWHCGASPILAAEPPTCPPHGAARRAHRLPRLLGRRAPRQRRPPLATWLAATTAAARPATRCRSRS